MPPAATNLSRSGMFIRTDQPLSEATSVGLGAPSAQWAEATIAGLEALVDQTGCERTQRRILRDIWAGVETSIAEVVALNYDAEPFSD